MRSRRCAARPACDPLSHGRATSAGAVRPTVLSQSQSHLPRAVGLEQHARRRPRRQRRQKLRQRPRPEDRKQRQMRQIRVSRSQRSVQRPVSFPQRQQQRHLSHRHAQIPTCCPDVLQLALPKRHEQRQPCEVQVARRRRRTQSAVAFSPAPAAKGACARESANLITIPLLIQWSDRVPRCQPGTTTQQAPCRLPAAPAPVAQVKDVESPCRT